MSDWEEVKDRAQMFIKRDDDTIAIQTTTTIVTIMDLITVGDELQREIATKDAELARLREALEDIDKLEIRRMYETCPDCYSESLGCSENKVCAQFKGRTLIQKVIDEALKSQ